MDAILQWGVNVVLAVQTLPGLEGVMEIFTFLGNEEFFLLVMPLLYWCVDAGLGARVAALLVASNSLNGLVKLALHLPRPYWIDTRVQVMSVETSYGLPSGHAQNATAIWGALAAHLRRAWTWVAALAVILLISLSRVYLGVHFPTDLLGGWIIGGALLFAFVRWDRPVTAWLRSLALWLQIGLALAVSLIYLALAAGIVAALAPTPDPATWEQNAILAAPPEEGAPATAPRSLEGVTTSAGTLLGLGAALALAAHSARFDARGPLVRRGLRFAVGLAGTLIIFFGLRLVAPEEPALVSLMFRYFRYALVVFWVLYLAPWAFLKFRLAEPSASSSARPSLN
jgi:membrane-associated phospholipid phosphatase